MTSIAIYLVPVYIIVLCVLVNYIAIRTSPTLRSRLSTSHTIRYCIPYPFILIGLPPSHASTTTSGPETTQRGGNPVSFFFSSLRPGSSSSQPQQQGHGLGGRTRTTSTSNSNATNNNGSTINGIPGQGDPLTDILARHLHLGNNHANRGGRIARGLGLGSGRGAAASSGTPTSNTTPAGTTTNTTTTTSTTTTTTPAVSGRVITRGGRRWGRTGSQRSTQTLPLYEEDVGAEDVVLIRKRESLRQMGRGEETDIVEGQNEDEDDQDNAGPSSQLLREEDEAGQSSTDVDHDNNDNDVRSDETHTGATTSPTANSPDRGRTRASSVSTSDIPDRGWGEAPSYDTAVPPPRFDFDIDPESCPAGGRTGSGNANATGGGGFRAFVGRLTGGRAEQHRRGFSTGSTATDDDRAGLMRMSTSGTSTGRNRGWSNASSMRNVSGASTPGMMSQVSLLSVNNNNINNSQPMTRFSSRLSSFGGATPTSASSSVINLNGPISGPLPGSLIRSSFDAPRAGFSAKQVEFLSSTDSLGKYGVRVDADGNTIDSGIGLGRARGSSVGSTARPSVDDGPGLGTGWRALAREEQAAASSSGTAPAPLHIQIPRADDVEIEIVPPTPTITSGQ